MIKVTFLGTGTSQGVPVIGCQCEVCSSENPKDKRLRSSIFIETETANIVIDTGADFRQQMLREKVRKLDAVLFTHEHKDHTAGLDDIRPFNFLQKKKICLSTLPKKFLDKYNKNSPIFLQKKDTQAYHRLNCTKFPKKKVFA
jgi:phosphoribosyl 1,2-cyclic phosphate phosphodiesterase